MKWDGAKLLSCGAEAQMNRPRLNIILRTLNYLPALSSLHLEFSSCWLIYIMASTWGRRSRIRTAIGEE